MDSVREPVVHVFSEELIRQAAYEATVNREDLKVSEVCACFACDSYFFSQEIHRYTQIGSAICPSCGWVAIIPDASHLPLTPGFLRMVREYVLVRRKLKLN